MTNVWLLFVVNKKIQQKIFNFFNRYQIKKFSSNYLIWCSSCFEKLRQNRNFWLKISNLQHDQRFEIIEKHVFFCHENFCLRFNITKILFDQTQKKLWRCDMIWHFARGKKLRKNFYDFSCCIQHNMIKQFSIIEVF